MFDPVNVEIKVARPLTGPMDGLIIRAIAEKLRWRGWRYRIVAAVLTGVAVFTTHAHDLGSTIALLVCAGVFLVIGDVICHKAQALYEVADNLQHKQSTHNKEG